MSSLSASKNYFSTFCLLVLYLVWGNYALADAKGAYVAIRKIDMRIEQGIKFDELGHLISDAKLELELYKNENLKNERLSNLLDDALSRHEVAYDLWSYQVSNSSQLIQYLNDLSEINWREKGEFLYLGSPKDPLQLDRSTEPVIEQYGLRDKVKTFGSIQVISIRAVLTAIWDDAKKFTDEALPLVR